ncbi:MAG TPA: substrate-binding domain-containing protein [Aromatoleum sp.]|uniref:substrate-binding domain-containing protein n=1 Tax=Aromatoleum sp. TaxID=2307007 RepID=UPI002B45B646|nr:substrate-binding domain-containing protein [Aromatoleum sp.]HJV26805.1 substrate-binding domain-containing protein [Aromatoleum sp.]
MKLRQLIIGAIAASTAIVAFAQEVTVAGSTTVQKRVLEPGAAGLKTATGIDVKVQGSGTGKGMIALFEGKVPAAAASETLEEAVGSAQKAAKEAEKSISVPGNLQFHEITKDVIVVIVNKDNKISALTKEQLKDINAGKIKNWKEVGGNDLPIKVVTSHAGSATRAVFQKQVMDGVEYVADATEARTTREEIAEVSREPGGIGAVSEGFFAQNPSKAKTVKAPNISRPLALVTVGEAKPEIKKILDFFASAEGKKLIQ